MSMNIARSSTVDFATIFTVLGQYVEEKTDGVLLGEARIDRKPSFLIFFLFDMVGDKERGLAIYATKIGSTIMLTPIGSMCYCVVRHRLEESRMRSIRRIETHSRSYLIPVASDIEL
ncbi:hypothetical protein CQW23_01969 [Capsicum baccatum]|uniref:Uncharacterized protein n=1 Tax=Capsicum baccatum TaxID=33114 RepID=A0A2G2XQ27_CAPBA|nr:hypothetical protein CQW23_01969 [Capsicum baccatum]